MSNSTDNSMKTALVFGATGAVGKQLLMDVLKTGTYSKVITMGRREVKLDDSIPQDKLVQKVIDFDNLEASRDDFRGVNDVYCCLATTRKEAGSADNFVKIDQGYVLSSAKLVQKKINPRLLIQHSVPFTTSTAQPLEQMKNSMFLYPKTKGETEEALKQTGFEKVSIFRPALLETVEPRPNNRIVESIALAVIPSISHFFNLHQSVSVKDVGRAMHKVAEDNSIKPSSPNGVSTSTLGTTIQLFFTADIETIVSSDKK